LGKEYALAVRLPDIWIDQEFPFDFKNRADANGGFTDLFTFSDGLPSCWTNRSLFRRLLAIKYSNGLLVEPIRLVKRGATQTIPSLPNSNEVEDDALLCRAIEMQAVDHHNLEEVRGREPTIDRRLQIVGRKITTGRA